MSKKIIKKLKELKEDSDNRLEINVYEELLDDYNEDDEVLSYIKDVCSLGCQSGICGNLIYYKDTCDFYDKYEDEIEDLLEDYGNNIGYENRFDIISSLNGSDNVGNLTQEKNLLAWFGYEQVLLNLKFELGME